jgi:hypothetical protein
MQITGTCRAAPDGKGAVCRPNHPPERK